jgi:hypothetical protein
MRKKGKKWLSIGNEFVSLHTIVVFAITVILATLATFTNKKHITKIL